MMDEDELTIEYYSKDNQRDYHLRQFTMLYESTKALGEFIKNNIDVTKEYLILDAGCGAGQNIYQLSKIFTNSIWLGIDSTRKFFDIGRNYLDGIDYILAHGDFNHLDELLDLKSFDISFSIQTLSWLPHYEKALEQLFKITNKYIFISSLFTDFDIDINITLKYFKSKYENDYIPHYNIYSLDRFKDICIDYGAKDIIVKNFDMPIDIAKPKHKYMNTYTIKTEDGKRLQFSGSIFLPWKFILIKL